MVARALAVLVLAGGCGATSGSAATARPLECDAVISSLMARSEKFVAQVWAGQQLDVSVQLATVIERVKPVMIESCRRDRWSPELLACMDRLTVVDDPHKCNHLVTEDQAVALARRFVAVMSQPVNDRSRGPLPP
jgi:hypothetical protein